MITLNNPRSMISLYRSEEFALNVDEEIVADPILNINRKKCSEAKAVNVDEEIDADQIIDTNQQYRISEAIVPSPLKFHKSEILQLRDSLAPIFDEFFKSQDEIDTKLRQIRFVRLSRVFAPKVYQEYTDLTSSKATNPNRFISNISNIVDRISLHTDSIQSYFNSLNQLYDPVYFKSASALYSRLQLATKSQNFPFPHNFRNNFESRIQIEQDAKQSAEDLLKVRKAVSTNLFKFMVSEESSLSVQYNIAFRLEARNILLIEKIAGVVIDLIQDYIAEFHPSLGQVRGSDIKVFIGGQFRAVATTLVPRPIPWHGEAMTTRRPPVVVDPRPIPNRTSGGGRGKG